MTKTKLKWRLSKLPTSEEVLTLVNGKIITTEEAKEILFTNESEQERSEKDLKEEIKFLRELVEKLSSNNQTRIIETIRQIEKPYYTWEWYKPYSAYTGGTASYTTGSGGTTLCSGSARTDVYTADCSNVIGAVSFSEIKTF